MKKRINNTRNRSLKMTMKLLGAAFFTLHSSLLTSCSDWDDHYNMADAVGGSNQTLWEQLKGNDQLSDFCEVLEQTKVFRMHKKTPVSYADLLRGGQAFTVIAPVNGTFDKARLLQLVQTAQGDSIVEKSFVKNHLSRSLCSVRADEERMMLLNNKHVTIADGKIAGVGLSTPNMHAKNGILHVASQPIPYRSSIYEALSDNEEFSAIGRLLRAYEEDYFDANSSVSSGIVDGVPVYVDSVVIERNRMLNSLGLINSEDSAYWMVAPTTAGWQKAWDETKRYFVFDEKMEKRDSLQQYYTIRALLDDAVFSLTNQQAPNDSLLSVQYLYERPNYSSPKPVYHVFKKPFEAGGILNGAERVECSNGTLFKVAQWPLQPEKTFFRQIWVEGEQTAYITEYNKCTYNTRQLSADSISDGAYLRILPTDGTANWEMTYRINNTLSGDYDICAVILPKSVYNQTNPDMRPCKFKATLNYVDEQGNAQSYACKNSDGKTEFTTDPSRIDTVVVAERFHFPACNYGQTEIKVSLKLTCSITSRQTSSYAREMFLDCIYLRPRKNIEN